MTKLLNWSWANETEALVNFCRHQGEQNFAIASAEISVQWSVIMHSHFQVKVLIVNERSSCSISKRKEKKNVFRIKTPCSFRNDDPLEWRRVEIVVLIYFGPRPYSPLKGKLSGYRADPSYCLFVHINIPTSLMTLFTAPPVHHPHGADSANPPPTYHCT